jgi:putative restriction endonuclease
MDTLNINNVTYNIIDTKEKMTVPDCFVKRNNKIGGGNGEAKFYIGNNNNETRNFFGTIGFNIKCFLLKKDLKQYLEDSKSEYLNPDQEYRNKANMPKLWKERVIRLNELEEILWFNIIEQTQISGSRIYIKSKSVAYDLIREFSLPNITYLSAIKLKSHEGEIVYYFRLFVDYFGDTVHPSIIKKAEEEIKEEDQFNEEEKTQLIKARSGQGKYRKELLEECPICPVTLVSDDRLLIASHIKPWIDSTEKEKTDPKNGFMFTPTFDFLFDRGFISFSENKKMLVSPWLSKITCSRLNISPNKTYIMLPVEGREKYLKYHRTVLFKG